MTESFEKLRAWCEAEDYKGWDPYDGLNSKLFQTLPLLKRSALCRLAMIQGFKRCPVNLRRLALVPKEHNAKGIGLFLQGYCNLYRLAGSPETKEEILGRIKYLADLLLEMRSDRIFPDRYHGACWGYNFDWQARRLFLFPKYTPTVVATSFCATALFEAYETTGIEKYRDVALSAGEFVMTDLHRHECREGFLLSYSPLKGNDTVYNASLLGSRLLGYCYKYSGKEEYKEAARQSVMACCDGQEADGSWVYGLLPVQGWKDSFHTGYNLDGLVSYEELTGDSSFHENVEKGFKYYIESFFEADGTPKYYNDRMYPIDIHCPGQLFVTLSRLHKLDEYRPLAEKVMNWTIKNMQDKKGYFYYQLKPGISSKISYMRWSNAFMFCAMSYYLLERND
ncbi:MAG: glycoside hydrolase family 88 protein [Bacteroidales bacterium]|nr:glycoside hydrolase family 88 protein [Candidatus Cacconaster scatequi]